MMCTGWSVQVVCLKEIETMLRIFSRWGAIITLIMLLIALVRQLISLITFLLFALKIGIIVVFVGLFLLVVLAILRGRGRARRESEEI
jgi:predicted membrane protein